MAQPAVTMVIVSWNVRDALRRCLRSAQLVSGLSTSIVVVDNASSDGSDDMVRTEFSNVRLIENSTNRGFAAAVNQGAAGANSHILLLNPDVELEPETLSTLIKFFESHSRAGILGTRLSYPDGELQRSVKRFPRWLDLVLVLSKLPNYLPSLVNRYQASDFDYHKTQIVDQVMGSCYLIRRETWEELGRLDERFWIWFEEVDYCRRAAQQGWQTWYVAEAQARHGRGQSFQQVSARRKQGYLRQSIRHYARKHFGWWATFALWPVLGWSWLAGWLIDGAGLQKPMRAKEF